MFVIAILVLLTTGALSYRETSYTLKGLDRNKVVNKGVWVRNNKVVEKPLNHVFASSPVGNEYVQNDYTLHENGVPNTHFVSSYFERNKRSLNDNVHRNSLDKEHANSGDPTKTGVSDKDNQHAIIVNSSGTNFKNYNYYDVHKNNTKNQGTEADIKTKLRILGVTIENISENALLNKNVREIIESAKEPPSSSILNQLSAINEKTIVKSSNKRPHKLMSEKGLIKILAMLSKTFKKIMRQHDDIKKVYTKLNTMNVNFLRNVEILSDKFLDFGSKYDMLVNCNRKFKILEDKLKNKEEYFKTKETELAQNLKVFDSEQQKFLIQQRHFLTIQKDMLEQNVRINAKQNQIAKTQSEISQRQNDIARILQRAKRIFINKKYSYKLPFVNYVHTAQHNNSHMHENKPSARVVKTTIEPTKINLFSIQSSENSKIKNVDHLLLSEKDDHSIDDLVYKYYFNNTFLDDVMKKFLFKIVSTEEKSNYHIDNEQTEKTNSEMQNPIMMMLMMDPVSHKRQEVAPETTILLPLTSQKESSRVGDALNRKRRWIPKKKMSTSISDFTSEEKTKRSQDEFQKKDSDKASESTLDHNDPFVKMARDFCNGINKNANQQVLEWCVEKALRKLKNIDIKIPTANTSSPSSKLMSSILPGVKPSKKKKQKKSAAEKYLLNLLKKEKKLMRKNTNQNQVNLKSGNEPQPETADAVSSTAQTSTEPSTTSETSTMFFPDNDELESNLKDYDLIPDTEGNVYFDGSLHASDVVTDKHDHGFASNGQKIHDVDSVSRIETDSLELKSSRENIKRLLKKT